MDSKKSRAVWCGFFYFRLILIWLGIRIQKRFSPFMCAFSFHESVDMIMKTFQSALNLIFIIFILSFYEKHAHLRNWFSAFRKKPSHKYCVCLETKKDSLTGIYDLRNSWTRYGLSVPYVQKRRPLFGYRIGTVPGCLVSHADMPGSFPQRPKMG